MNKFIPMIPNILLFLVLLTIQTVNHSFELFLILSLIIGYIIDEKSFLKLFLVQIVSVFSLIIFSGIETQLLNNFAKVFKLNEIMMIIIIVVFSGLSFAIPAKIASELKFFLKNSSRQN